MLSLPRLRLLRATALRLPARAVAWTLVSGPLLLILGGCGGQKPGGSDADKNIYHVAMLSEPTTFDPAMVQDGTTIDMLQQVYEGLVQWTTDNKLAPCLATGWTVSPDGKTYTFKIRQGVKFHSGKVVTADDVAYSLTRTLDPKLASPVGLTYLGDIEGADALAKGTAKTLSGVKVIDPQTIAVTITKPKAYWLNILTYPTAYVVNKDAVAKDPKGQITDQNEDGTGAFTVSQYKRGDYVDLKADKDYWDGAPKIDGQHRPIIVDANTRHNEYVQGELDIVDLSAGTVAADMNDPVLKNQLKFWPRSATYYVGLDQAAFPAFKDVRVRQAFAYATDKKRIITTVFDGHRVLAEDLLPEGIPGYDTSFKGIPYDPAKAKALMAAAGFPGGKGFPVLPMYYRESYPDIDKTVDLLRQMYLTNLGVTVQPKRTEWATMLSLDDQNTALASTHMRWSADYLDPQDFYSVLLDSHSIEDHVGYKNPSFDTICEAADVEQDAAKRAALYRRAARIAADDAPRIPIYYQQDPELIKPYVGGLDDCLMGHLPYKHLTLDRK